MVAVDVHLPRERWSRKVEFIFACVGFAVGYGNFWRFPFKCFKNGGGAFLIPFLICLVFAGLPLFMMELALGQYFQAGPLGTWRELCPIMGGVGYAMIIVCFLVSVYYNVILAWSCYYFFNSFKSDLPWVATTGGNSTGNASSISTPSRDFFINDVLSISNDINETGTINWKIALCLLLAWVAVYFCIWKGIRTTGKVVYITATLPYLMLLVFFIRGLTLEGASNGILYYVTPVWDKLLTPDVWVDAASQVFYSLTLGFGVMLTFASYNKRDNNLIRDALLIGITDALTSVFSGFVVFAIMGYMAHLQGKDVDDPTIATDGPGLVFIVYPAALATLPQPQVWSVIFFLMLITLGLDSQFGQVELICTCIIEEYPRTLGKYKELVVLAVCVLLFLCGLLCVADSGMYWFHLIDSYSAGTSLLFLGIIEVITVAWIYGAERFRENIESMVGFRISAFWVVLWKFVTPVIVLPLTGLHQVNPVETYTHPNTGTALYTSNMAIFLFGLVKHKPLKYETYLYPDWAQATGWLMAIASMICVPLYALYVICKSDGNTFKDKCLQSCRPVTKFVVNDGDFNLAPL